MALAKPMVQFNLSEGRVSAQGASLYARNVDVVDFATKILKLIDDASLRETMGAFGLARVKNKLCWAHEAPKLLKAYDSLFTGARQTRTSESVPNEPSCSEGRIVAHAQPQNYEP